MTEQQYGTSDEARSAMEAARVDVMECEKVIQSVKTALRDVGMSSSSSDAGSEGNTFKVSAVKVTGLPDAATPSFKLQLSSPVEEATLTKLVDPLDDVNAEGSIVSFTGVEITSAMLTVTASDADIVLGSSASHDVAPLCEFDPLKPTKKVTELDVAIVADGSAGGGGSGGTGSDDAAAEASEAAEDESADIVETDTNETDKSVYFDASDHVESASSPRPVVFCGPSGVGKGTLIDMLMKKYPDAFGFSVSHTTRDPRDGEEDGVHYNFTTVENIKKEIEEDKFIEYAEVHGRYYGTSIAAVETVQSSGKICILDIDVQGVRSVKKSSLEPLYVFIAPPSKEALEDRLRGRGTEKEEDIVKRLANAQAELDYGLEEGNFDRVFTNDDLDETFQDLAAAFEDWYPHLSSSSHPKKEEEKKEDATSASESSSASPAVPAIETPVCTVTLKVEFEPSKKDQKDELYDMLNKASKKKATAIDKLRKSAAAVSRLSKDETTSTSRGSSAPSGTSRSPAVKAGFLNKKEKKAEPGALRRLYERTIGPNSLLRMVFPVAKNYIVFFGTVLFMHYQGQQLALPPPV